MGGEGRDGGGEGVFTLKYSGQQQDKHQELGVLLAFAGTETDRPSAARLLSLGLAT